MDPLSDVLSLLKPRSYLSAGLDAGGEWSLRFPAHEGIKFNAVTRGACWVFVEGHEPTQRLEEGDCFLLTRGRPFVLTTDPSREPVDATPTYASAVDGVARFNGGGDFTLVGGRFAFSADHGATLFGSLPAVVHVREASAQASVLRWSLDQFTSELRARQPGGALVAEHLAHLMLVQILRRYLTAAGASSVGWLYALSNRQIGSALAAMHAEPARRWSLASLAARAGMSRSTFSERFKELVGESPIEYLTRWRMLLAGRQLQTSEETVASIAYSLGYESEAAFSTAFKRILTCSPSHYRSQHRTSSQSPLE